MKNEVWGYARVSTKEQNLARQIEQLKEFGISERNIKCDKISGKTFNRMEYNALVGTETTAPTLREGDLLVIVSLDRLGRNYTEIKEQWNYIINVIGADIVVLDMPLLDTRQSGDNLEDLLLTWYYRFCLMWHKRNLKIQDVGKDREWMLCRL